MFDKIKIPLLATFAIIIMFFFQSMHLIKLVSKDLENRDIIELMAFSKEIETNFEKINFKSTLIYQYAILNNSGRVLTSNLKKMPPNFNFQVLTYKGYTFYKHFFLYKDELVYVVASKKIEYGQLIFLTSLMFFSIVMTISLIMYFMYLSIVKPHLEQRKMMNIFFNDAMHELKTPLGVASINLEMLDVRTKHTHRIKSALKQMKLTYEDVEYYIKNRQVEFPKKILNLSFFIKERIKFISTIAHSKNMEIISEIEDDLFIYMSEIEATRLVDNNISNAIKYSNISSKIIVSLTKSNNYAIFTIQDFGKGIKEPKNIWNRYTREDMSLGGFGLGLNIVLNICLKHDILYYVDSIYGKGTTFKYKIPLYTNKFLDNVI